MFDYLTNKVGIIAHCRNISGVATEDSELINYLESEKVIYL